MGRPRRREQYDCHHILNDLERAMQSEQRKPPPRFELHTDQTSQRLDNHKIEPMTTRDQADV
jgi:hypothetical protein